MLIGEFAQRLHALDPIVRRGRIRSVLPTHYHADGPSLPLGALCRVETDATGPDDAVLAEVVRVDDEGITLSPFQQNIPVRTGARVVACGQAADVPVGPECLGRAIDALARPIDSGPPLPAAVTWPLHGVMHSPLDRAASMARLTTGIRSIDGLLPLGAGQRIGLFAPSGAGKTTLLSQIVAQASADIVVICLIGERGREVGGMWTEMLDASSRRRTVMVAATSDQSAAMRVRAAHCALAQAEYWRDQGRHVLLLLDSATRLAMAMRELGLASGEPPTVRGYTPGVFAAMPRIVERCGAVRAGGAITAVLTVLSETDDIDDPICEMLKSLLDGHIVLSRALAEKGQFPAIDILRSVSRQSERLMAEAQRIQARQIRQWLSTHEDARTLIEAGLYSRGASATIDQAVDRNAAIIAFLQQEQTTSSAMATTLDRLADLCGAR